MKYKRILLKLSGSFFSTDGNGLDFDALDFLSDEIIKLQKKGVQIGIVNGAGNIFRGRSKPKGFDQIAADKIGIISTVPNSLALTETLNHKGAEAYLMCAFSLPGIARQIDVFRARKLLNNNKIVIFAGGTGQPLFSTDTAAVLRAIEIKADILLKATDVDGVYSEDPQINKKAQKYSSLTYTEALNNNLNIMDQTAFSMAKEFNLPMLVFKFKKDSLIKIVKDKSKGTIIKRL